MSEVETMTLTEFLLARIADRESVARDMRDQIRLGRPFFDLDRLAGGTGIRELIDPARVLAECEAKRRIVELHGGGEFHVDPCDAHDPSGHTIPCDTLHALALPYADHPDYREEWRA